MDERVFLEAVFHLALTLAGRNLIIIQEEKTADHMCVFDRTQIKCILTLS